MHLFGVHLKLDRYSQINRCDVGIFNYLHWMTCAQKLKIHWDWKGSRKSFNNSPNLSQNTLDSVSVCESWAATQNANDAQWLAVDGKHGKYRWQQAQPHHRVFHAFSRDDKVKGLKQVERSSVSWVLRKVFSKAVNADVQFHGVSILFAWTSCLCVKRLKPTSFHSCLNSTDTSHGQTSGIMELQSLKCFLLMALFWAVSIWLRKRARHVQ